MEYTEEMKKDILERTAKAVEMLKELQLAPQAQVSKGKVVTTDGIELFADRITPYLQDTKFLVKESDVKSDVLEDEKPVKED